MTAFLLTQFCPLAFSNLTRLQSRPLAIDKHHVALGKIGETKMNFRSLTQILSRTRSAPLRYEACSGIGKKKILIVDDNSDLRKLLALVLKNSDYDTTEAARVDRFSNLFCVGKHVFWAIFHSAGLSHSFGLDLRPQTGYFNKLNFIYC
jgi:hypothetical protein